MSFFNKKTPLQKELEKVQEKEKTFLLKHFKKTNNALDEKLMQKIPVKLKNTLNTAFIKAFTAIFENGTNIIEKTFKRQKLEQDFLVNKSVFEIKQSSKTLRSFSKKAKNTGNKNLAISGTIGVGMGALGIGLPDIPIFTGMILKNIYEISLNYGYKFDTEEEKYFILMLIQGALSHGEQLYSTNQKLNDFIKFSQLPPEYNQKQQIEKTAELLSTELICIKFLQGIPLIGVVGGAYNAVYMQKTTSFAAIKYKYRFIFDQLNNNHH